MRNAGGGGGWARAGTLSAGMAALFALGAACSGEDEKAAGASGGSGAGGAGGGSGGVVGGSGSGGQTAGSGGASGSMTTDCPGTGEAAGKTLRIYVAGESIEERNRFVEPPFRCDGTLNPRGGGDAANDNDEYGWMVPLAARLRVRAPGFTVEWVGAGPWTGADDSAYSGSYPSTTPGRTSAIAGTDIGAWLDEGSTDRGIPPRRQELQQKLHCYDLALAARGGNDLNQEVADSDYKERLKTLVRLLAEGSSCKTDPLVVVTAHLPDRADVAAQDRVFQRLASEAVAELKADASWPQAKRDRLRFVDAYGAFRSNKPTTSQPQPAWFSAGAFDNKRISRDGDSLHPRRLASIYMGEIVADSFDLGELYGL
jgi:hypothetical protein